MTTNGNAKIEEALELLREAAKDKKGEVEELLTGKYDDLRDLFLDLGEDVVTRARKAGRKARAAQEDVTENVKEFATDVDKHLHEDPWPVLGWVAVGALVIGYLMGRKD